MSKEAEFMEAHIKGSCKSGTPLRMIVICDDCEDMCRTALVMQVAADGTNGPHPYPSGR